MKVLSLFDGISCGMVALERAEIPVEKYIAYEIDKYAIQVSQNNYPQIEHCGDVTTADFTKYKGFDLLIGGSPCTYWSIAKKDRETTSDGIGFQLFSQYVRALRESSCKYFLYENNYSIHKDIKAEITKALGVEPIMINSALLSAQSRKRCYWTNIPNVTQPEDKGILLKDILESGEAWQDKAFTYTTRCQGAILDDTLKRHRHTMVAEPVCVAQRGCYIESGNRSKKCDGGVYQAFEPRTDGKANCMTTVTKDCLICEPIRIGTVEHGGRKDCDSKQWRVYSVRGKSVTLCGQGGGAGAKTGLYKIDLPDGDYIIRILTPIEAERLQTLPDNYTAGVSNTQRYKGIGNGWTVDVIAHILKGLK